MSIFVTYNIQTKIHEFEIHFSFEERIVCDGLIEDRCVIAGCVVTLIGWMDGADAGCPLRQRYGGEGAFLSWSRREHSEQCKK